MSMYVNTKYDGFMATTTVTSDSIDEIDLSFTDFKIEILDQLSGASTAASITQLVAAVNVWKNSANEDEPTKTNSEVLAEMDADIELILKRYRNETDATKKAKIKEEEYNKAKAERDKFTEEIDSWEKQIDVLVTNASEPLIEIGNSNYTEYCNSDDKYLIQNGFQFWVGEDKRSMVFRFIPRPLAKAFINSIVVAVSFDQYNATRFEVCMLPKLLTGNIEKVLKKPDEKVEDPIIGVGKWTTSSYDISAGKTVVTDHPTTAEYSDVSGNGELPRTDYIYNGEVDENHIYLNNTPYTSSTVVPIYQCESSAFISTDLMDAGFEFDWSKFKSDLYNVGAQSSIDISATVNGLSVDTSAAWWEGLEPIDATAVLVPTYTATDEPAIASANSAVFKMYKIVQTLSSDSQKPIYSESQLRCEVCI